MNHLIVGLGNPDKEYHNNRHNVGFLFLDFIVNQEGIKEKFLFNKDFSGEILKHDNLFLLKPSTYMNNSGLSVKKVINFYKNSFEEVTIVYDDLDILFKQFKIGDKSPRGHNGIKSILSHIDNINIRNIRIGVENRFNRDLINGADYVLDNFTKDEMYYLLNTLFPQIYIEIKNIYSE